MKRISTAAAAGFAVLVLVGCGNHGSESPNDVIAHVNNDTITRGEYITRLQNVTAYDLEPALQPGGPGIMAKAGVYALRSLIDEKLALALAAAQGCSPTADEVSNYVVFARKYRNPQLTLMPDDPYKNAADWARESKKTVALRKIMVKLSGITQADVDKTYTQYQTNLRTRDQYHLRLIDVKAKSKCETVLADLAKGVPFETEALNQSEDPVSRQKNGDIGTVPDKALMTQMPHLFALVKALKPGQYTRQCTLENVIPHTTPVGTQPVPEPRYFLAQLVEVIPGSVPSEQDVKPLLEILAMHVKDTTVGERLQSMLKDYSTKAKIQITLPGYEHIMDAQNQVDFNPMPSAPQ